MSVPIGEPTQQRAIAHVRYTAKDTRQKPLASQWITPVNGGDPIPNDEPDWTPELQNSWVQPDAPLEQFSFRLHYDGSLEFKGHLDASGASSGSVAFVLPGLDGGEPDYTLAKDQFFLTVIYDGASPQSAMVYIDSVTAEVTITWPL